jgi:ABC-type transport system involved in multi-copper enzyme maturation permease subunit
MTRLLWTNIRVNLRFYLRNRLLTALAVVLIFMMALFAIPSLLVTTAGQRLAMVRQIVTQLSFFGTFFTGLLGLLTVSHHLRNRSLKMVVTKPCPLEVWLLAHFLSAALVAAGLYTAVFLIGSALAAVWRVPIQQGLAAMMTHDLLQAVSIFAFLVFLTTFMHPALAAVVVLLFQEGTFHNLLVWVMAGLDVKSSLSAGLFFSATKYFLQSIYFVLPSWSPYSEKLVHLGQDLEFTRNQLPFLLSSITYWLLLGSFCYFSAILLLRRKRFT